jgi:hypothetical protein
VIGMGMIVSISAKAIRLIIIWVFDCISRYQGFVWVCYGTKMVIRGNADAAINSMVPKS